MADLVPEIVRGRLTDDRASAVLGFWARHGALEGDAARQRLAEVVTVLVDRTSGEIAGVNSVYADRVSLVGNRWFWIYRRFHAPGTPPEAEVGMFNAAFDALAEEFSPDGPVGVCVFVDDPELIRLRREAIWPETDLWYVGYEATGEQVRIRYFEDARI